MQSPRVLALSAFLVAAFPLSAQVEHVSPGSDGRRHEPGAAFLLGDHQRVRRAGILQKSASATAE